MKPVGEPCSVRHWLLGACIVGALRSRPGTTAQGSPIAGSAMARTTDSTGELGGVGGQGVGGRNRRV